MGSLEMPEGGLEVVSLQRLVGPFHFLFVRFIHVGAHGLREREMCSLRCTVGGAGGQRQRRAPNGRNRTGKGPNPRSNVGAGARRSRARSGGPARGDGMTTRSIGETATARVPTVRLKGLSVRPCTAESAAIEDIPSSMQTEGTHHERQPASRLHLQHLSRQRLHLRLPASRRTSLLRLRPAVPVRRAMPVRHAVPVRRRRQLRPVLSRGAIGTTPAAAVLLPLAP